MTDPTPEPHDPDNPPAPPPQPEPEPCVEPNRTAYRNRTQAAMALGSGTSRVIEECPAGHWHVVPRRNDRTTAPAPAPTDPPQAETEPGNVQER